MRTEEGRRIREAFVVGEGYESLMTADYSQIEMRIMAHLSEDALLIEAFRSGQDFHSITAARVFDVAAEDVSTEQRAKIKAMNYGLAYGLSAFGLGQQLGIEPSEARGLMDEYFETFGGVRDYLGGVVDEARRTGFTETLRGRRRYLPDLTSDNRQRREMAADWAALLAGAKERLGLETHLVLYKHMPGFIRGIETEAEAKTLAGLGVNCLQGYLWGRPARAPGPAARMPLP